MNAFLLKNVIEVPKEIFIFDFIFSIENFFDLSIKLLNIVCQSIFNKVNSHNCSIRITCKV